MLQSPLHKFTATPKGITIDGMPLTKASLNKLSPQAQRYVQKAEALLKSMKAEDWNNFGKPHDMNHVPKIAEVNIYLALANPIPMGKYNFNPDQPRDEYGRWTDEDGDAGEDGGDDSSGEYQVADAGNVATDANVDSKPDITNAINLLRDNAEPKPTGYCATYVRDALNAGGFDVQPPQDGHGYAKNFGSSLENAGFEQIASATHTENQPATYPPGGHTPQKGDVVVMDTYPTSPNQAGHMAMYDGTQWISDWKQHSFWPGSGYRSYGSSYTIYRYPNK